MNTETKNAIEQTFKSPENPTEPVFKTLQEFVHLLPVPEGAEEIRLVPVRMDDDECVITYEALIIWPQGDRNYFTRLFGFKIDLEDGFPVQYTCIRTIRASNQIEFEGILLRLAEEVRAKLWGIKTLKDAGELTTGYLERRPEAPEPPPLMIQVGE